LNKADFKKSSSALNCILDVCDFDLSTDTANLICVFCGYPHLRKENTWLINFFLVSIRALMSLFDLNIGLMH